MTMLPAMLLFAAVHQLTPPCPRQPMPPGESALPARPYETVIVYDSVPSFSRDAWVVRISRRISSGPASIEVARLRRQRDCNRYDIEAQWRGLMPAEEFLRLGRQLAPRALAGGASTSDDPMTAPAEVAIDGTTISLTLRNHSWEVRRDLVEGGRDGAPVAELFRSIMARVIRAEERAATSR